MSKGKYKIKDKFVMDEDRTRAFILRRSERYYVYALVNPLNNLPVYIGKGQGFRCFDHWYEDAESTVNTYKYRFLNKLYKKGYEIKYVIYCFTDDEGYAYQKEAELIYKYGLKIHNIHNLLYNLDSGNGVPSQLHRQEVLINEFKKLHKNRYDYSKVKYKGSNLKVEIGCNKHNVYFWQLPTLHYSHEGCPLCSKTSKMTTESFIIKSKEVHGDLYCYDKSVYTGSRNKLTVTCKKHGDFNVRPDIHYSGSICIKCARDNMTNNKEEYIEKCKKEYGNIYSYDKTEYKNNWEKVTVTCKKHGDFQINPSYHLRGGGKCPKC